jgi:uncharacterized LabA/DUF88 family protein
MLVNAFNKNYDVGGLVSGDEDYVTVVREAKRYGPQILGCFFEKTLSESLASEFDRLFLIGSNMQSGTYENHRAELKEYFA